MFTDKVRSNGQTNNLPIIYNHYGATKDRKLSVYVGFKKRDAQKNFMKETLDKCKVQYLQNTMIWRGVESVDYYNARLHLMIHIISKTN